MNSKWKKFCTCIGCAVGFVCIVASGGTATPLVAAALVGGGGAVGYFTGHKMDQDEKKVKNQEQTVANQTKAIENLAKENKEAKSELDELKKQHEELAKQKEKNNKDLEFAKNKANDPNLTEEERRHWRLKVVEIEERMGRNDEEDRLLLKRIKEIQDKISNNNKTISNITTSNSGKKDIWEFITLENILIAVAIYTLWQIVRDNNRRY